MFEQENYEREMPAAKTAEGDLFHNYEIKTWEPSKRLYQILAFSALLNISALAIVMGTNLLTRRGCDSPFVGRVCQVLDMAYVGSIVLGTERDYVDKVYEDTDLGDADITFISRDGNNAKLYYPADYFQIANPQQYAAQQAAAAGDPSGGFPGGSFNAGPIPGIPYTPTPQNNLLNTTPTLPKSNPNPVKGSIPDSPFAVGGDETATTRKGRKGGKVTDPKTDPTPDGEETAKAEPTPSATPLSSEAVTSLEVNKRPLTDLLDEVADKSASNQIDLNQPFTVTLNGVLTKDGKLDPKKSKFDKSREKGDPKMIEVARRSLEALGQTGFLTYLRSLGVDNINIVLVQDDKQISAVITSSQKTPELARTISSGANGYITIGKMAAKNPSDELTLLNGATVTADGSNFVLNFVVPKPVAQEMINRKVKEAQAKKAQQPQPNGTAVPRTSENTGKK